jgi:cytochrome c oxidase assembly protein subunit 15
MVQFHNLRHEKEKHMTGSTNGNKSTTGGHQYLLLAATVTTYLLITMGGIVCITESGLGCPDWPGCYGQIVPPLRMDAIIEYTHRFIAALASPLIIISAVVGWRKFRSSRWISWPPVIAVVFALAVIVFGALAVLRGLARGVAAIDLGSALMVLTLMVTATVVAFYHRDKPAQVDRLSLGTPFARLSLGTLVMLFVVLVSGVLVADKGSMARCLGWPLYSGGAERVDLLDWLQMGRRLLGGLTSILIVAVVVQAWRTQPKQAPIVSIATAMGVLFLAETLVGALIATRDVPVLLLMLYVAMATAVWTATVVLVVLAALASPAHAEEHLEVAQPTTSAV